MHCSMINDQSTKVSSIFVSWILIHLFSLLVFFLWMIGFLPRRLMSQKCWMCCSLICFFGAAQNPEPSVSSINAGWETPKLNGRWHANHLQMGEFSFRDFVTSTKKKQGYLWWFPDLGNWGVPPVVIHSIFSWNKPSILGYLRLRNPPYHPQVPPTGILTSPPCPNSSSRTFPGGGGLPNGRKRTELVKLLKWFDLWSYWRKISYPIKSSQKTVVIIPHRIHVWYIY